MALDTQSGSIHRFGTFEVDVRVGEVRRQGKRIKIQDQPFKVMAALLQRPGEVVSREELRKHIWPEDTFVDFDNGLNTSINKLREALGDSADSPRFIETLPRRGYRFIAPVTRDTRPEPALSSTSRRIAMVAPVVSLLLLVILGGLLWRSGHRPVLSEKDTLVLGDFTNSTGDSVFDGTLREGLSVQLEQSPFLSLVSEDGIHQTLRMMGRSNAQLTSEIAREVCQRTNSAASLEG
jgi:eukaryotic-like serine/threonine-protein kinase